MLRKVCRKRQHTARAVVHVVLVATAVEVVVL